MSDPRPDSRTGSASDRAPEQDAAGRRRLREEAERRQRLAAVFGDVLPDTTADERPAASSAEDGSAADRWLREQVPPHHG